MKDNTNTIAIDQTSQDFKNALFAVSVLANVTIFITWLTLELSRLG